MKTFKYFSISDSKKEAIGFITATNISDAFTKACKRKTRHPNHMGFGFFFPICLVFVVFSIFVASTHFFVDRCVNPTSLSIRWKENALDMEGGESGPQLSLTAHFTLLENETATIDGT